MSIAKYVSIVREKIKSITRSNKWDEVRDTFIEKNSSCAACGSTKKLQVHHIKPFHLHPELELEESNLITLCMDKNDCHLNVGHGDSWRCYNPNVKSDAEKFLSSPFQRSRLLLEIKKNRLS